MSATNILPAPIRRAIAGVEFLDRVEPGWVDLIDVSQLDIALNDRCVLGQLGRHLYPDCPDRLAVYQVAIDAYGIGEWQMFQCGFTGEFDEIDSLTAAWLILIQARQAMARVADRYGLDEVQLDLIDMAELAVV